MMYFAVFFASWMALKQAFVPKLTFSPLTVAQHVYVNEVLMHPEITPRARSLLENLLYNKYEVWALKQAHQYKRLHRHRCRNLPEVDLELCAKKALLDAIQIYYPVKPTDTFPFFAIHYLKRRFDRMSYTEASASAESGAGDALSYADGEHYMGNTLDYHDWMLNEGSAVTLRTSAAELWEHIHTHCDTLTRRGWTYKYDADFRQLRTNAEVATMVHCTEDELMQRFRTSLP